MLTSAPSTTTSCGCDSLSFTQPGGDGAPGDLEARQDGGRMLLSWVDQSLCEEAFTFSRIDNGNRVGFTDAYAYGTWADSTPPEPNPPNTWIAFPS